MTVMHANKVPLPVFDGPTIRPLNADDSEAYRALRKKILEIGDGRYFNTSYTREGKLASEEQWQEWCREKQEHCIIGIFIDEELVGTMMITMFGPPEDLTAEWEATWLDPRYRGCGIAKPAYEEVEKWTINHGYKHALVFIREDNLRSREIREKQGFNYIKTIRNEIWADGSCGSEHVFMKDLPSAVTVKDSPYARAVSHLESTHKSLVTDGHVLGSFSPQP